jgi:hypothetical protein
LKLNFTVAPPCGSVTNLRKKGGMRVVAMIFQMESYHRCFFSHTDMAERPERIWYYVLVYLFIFFCVSLCVTFAEAGIVRTVSQYICERKKEWGKAVTTFIYSPSHRFHRAISLGNIDTISNSFCRLGGAL